MYFENTKLSNPPGTNVLLLALNASGKFLHESVIGNNNLTSGIGAAVAGSNYPYVVAGLGTLGSNEVGWFGVNPKTTLLYLAKNSDADQHQRTGVSNQETPTLNLYPNPSTGMVFCSAFEQAQSIDVRDLQGKVVLHQGTASSFMDLSTLEKGIYLISVQLNSGVSSHNKIVIR